jgi:hypothetical protein
VTVMPERGVVSDFGRLGGCHDEVSGSATDVR